MSKLFNDDDSESECELKTDTAYAKNYNTWRKKEELHKLQARYGSDVGESDSSSSSDSDTDEDITQNVFDKNFYRVLSLLNSKDPRIYDKDFKLPEEENSTQKLRKKKNDPLYLKDYERNLLLEKGGQLSDDDDEVHSKPKSQTYVDEQKELKKSLKAALDEVDDDGKESADWGGLFKTRERTDDEVKKEDDEYSQWLKGQKEHLEDPSIESDLKPLKEYWSDPNLDSKEKFIRDYILNKKYTQNEDPNYIPTYNEIIHDSDGGFSEEEETINKQEQFEHKYNFRYEEPDQDFLKRFPRTIKDSVRKKDDKRAVQRHERKERKDLEKQQKMEDLRQMRNYKMKEIEEKIKTLQEITGDTDVAFCPEDIDEDFDPVKHDQRMQNLFNQEFYEGPEGDIKPEFPDLDEELEIEKWDGWKGNEEGNVDEGVVNDDDTAPHCEDQAFNMDCEYDPKSTQKELIENSRRKKKRKRKSQFAQVVGKSKPVFDPNNKTYEEYIEEYYKLDCEDIIGDLPCRFKYRKVVPNSFGLSIEEILSAKDKELNKWCSVKKAVQYRPEHVEKFDVIAYEQKRDNFGLKKRILPSLFTEEQVDENIVPSKSSNVVEDGDNTRLEEVSKKRKKKKGAIYSKEPISNKDEIEQGAIESSDHIKKEDISAEVIKKSGDKKKNIMKVVSRKEVTKDEISENIALDNTTDNNLKSKSKPKKKRKTSETVLINEENKNKLSASDVKETETVEQKINPPVGIEDVNSPQTKLKKKKLKKVTDQTQIEQNQLISGVDVTSSKEKDKNNKKRKRQTNVSEEGKQKKRKKDYKAGQKKFDKKNLDIGISDARLKAYGLNPKKFKNKLKYNVKNKK